MQDCSSVLRQIEQYEEHLHVACLAPNTGRVVPLRCEAFTGLYDTLLASPARHVIFPEKVPAATLRPITKP